MGLLYPFPVSTEETDFIQVTPKRVVLKTYGLPYLFWMYGLAILIVIVFMFFAIKAPILKLISLGDETDAFLGYSLFAFLFFLPVFLAGFYFYEKRIISDENNLELEFRIFGLKFGKEIYSKKEAQYTIAPFLTSPNMARLQGEESARGFQNKGYFVLWLNLPDGRKILIDRHSRKKDLEDLLTLIQLA